MKKRKLLWNDFHVPIYYFNFRLVANCDPVEGQKFLDKWYLNLPDKLGNGKVLACYAEYPNDFRMLYLGLERSRSIIRHEVSHLVLSMLSRHRQTDCNFETDEIYRLAEDYVYDEVIKFLKSKKFRLTE